MAPSGQGPIDDAHPVDGAALGDAEPPPPRPPEPAAELGALAQFFRRVRLRLRLRQLLSSLFLWLALFFGVMGGLGFLAGAYGASALWPPLSATVLALFVSALFISIHRYLGAGGPEGPQSGPLSDESIARFVGVHAPDLGSDLLSTVEFKRSPPAGCSPHLVTELCRRTGVAVATLSPAELVELRELFRQALLSLLPLVVLAVLGGVLPFSLREGLRTLFRVPPPNPVKVSSEPLVGDLRLILTYPRYTGLPPRDIRSSSGDVIALPGTQVRVEARALSPVDRAALMLSIGGPPKSQPVQITSAPDAPAEGDAPPLLVAGFVASQPGGSYYFQVERGHRDPVREPVAHRIDIETDRPPRVDLFAPAPDLEVTGTRRIELAYSAEDDLGLGEIDLVYRVGDGPEKHRRLRSAPTLPPVGAAAFAPAATKTDAAVEPIARSAAAKIEWDLAEIDLQPGLRVTYHVEARDLDTVSGPNVGRSREYSVRILSPHEKLEALLQDQEQLREQFVQLLGDRLELGRALPASSDPSRDPGETLERWLAAHRRTEALLLTLGRVQEAGERAAPNRKDLPAALHEIGQRLGRLVQDEAVLISDMRTRRAHAGAGAGKPQLPLRAVLAMNDRQVVELERDTLLLDDLIGRQRMEELLAIGDEMAGLRDRMKQLLAEYKRSPSEAIKRELERELRAFERRLAELSERARQLQSEVPDEFVNREALSQNDMQSRLAKLREMLARGDLAQAEAELDKMSQALDGLIRGMEGSLRSFRRERFTAEEKAFAEIESKLSDLAHDQSGIKQRTDDVRKRATERARQLLRDRADSLLRRIQGDLGKLRRLLSEVDVAPLGPWGSDELDKANKRLDDVAKMLEQGDLEEARAMAQEAEQSIGKLESELRGEEQASRWGQRVRIGRSRGKLEQSRPIIREVVSEIGKALPRPEDLLTPQERRQLGELRSEQDALGKRTGELGRELQRRAQGLKDAPLFERVQKEADGQLRRAAHHMEESSRELQGLSPRSAAAAQGQAMDQLGQLQKKVQEARRPQGDAARARADREPVRIPGADDYRAPREFRKDILDAAKREPPPDFREQVKRYYEELIQ